MLVTVFTPSYNRAKHLSCLFGSLQHQTVKDFEWLIVDDGSQDGTRKVVEALSMQSDFPIKYVYKENGGKHTAINKALDIVKSELFFIVDSDDILTNDAIESIEKDWEADKVKNLCGISYLRGYNNLQPIGDLFPYDNLIDSFANVRVRKHILGDKAEVWATRYLKRFRFPVFEGERFLVESWMWLQVSDLADMLFVNKVIYLTEYLQGGLTQSGRKLRIRCPRGGMDFSVLLMDKRYPWKDRIKNGLLYVAYSFFAHQPVSQTLSRHRVLTLTCLLPGYCLYRYWKAKYNR